MCITAADFRAGDACPEVVLVGACPGRDEEEMGRPFAGQAGGNLSVMLQRLVVYQPDVFPSVQLDDYSMINAHSLPRYRGREGYDGRTQPRKGEVLAQENRERFVGKFLQVQPNIVVYLGKAAQFSHEIVLDIIPDIKAFRTGHPSTPAWNTRPQYAQMERELKLRLWAEHQFAPV